ncbi:MAG: Fic family protein [Planctomycetaceae bacterium]|nr:Fic family protein [Planctomycetaceae bacterium]
MFNPDRPYNELPMLPPRDVIETEEVLRQLVKSHKALAELKGTAQTLPDQSVLINSILIQEAKDSSAIENIVTTHDELFQGLTLSRAVSPQVKEVLNYRSALWEGYDFIKNKGFLSVNSVCSIHERLGTGTPGIRKLPGTVLKNDRTGRTIYTPPNDPNAMVNLLKNLEIYFNTQQDRPDPLIKMAVAHYQFESIHPFHDGNGRTGRIINVLYLVLEKLLSSPILYMSRYIIHHKADYYRLLQEVRTKNNWTEWVLYVLKAVEETSKGTLALITSIRNLMEVTAEKMKTLGGRLYSHELLDTLFEKPYIRVGDLVAKGIATRNTASRYLNNLTFIGILKPDKIGRDILYLNKHLFILLKQQ